MNTTLRHGEKFNLYPRLYPLFALDTPTFQPGRVVMCAKGEARSRPFPTMREGIRQSTGPGRCGAGQRETVREKRLNHFHHIKVSSLCPQFVRTLSAVAFQAVTRMVAGFC